jgi:hypothetical protein
MTFPADGCEAVRCSPKPAKAEEADHDDGCQADLQHVTLPFKPWRETIGIATA